MRATREEIAEVPQDQGRHQRRSPHGDGHSEKRRIHGTDMGCVTGKEIVAVKVEQGQSDKGREPVKSTQLPPMVSLNQGMKPSLLRKLAIITRAANQTRVFQASFS